MKSRINIILFTVLLAAASWFIDSLVDHFFYYNQDFWSIAFTHVPGHEIFMRLVIIGIISSFGLFIARQVGIKNDNLKRLAHVNAVLAAVRNINQIITRVHDKDVLIKRACEELTKSREYHTSWICLVDKAGKPIKHAESGFGGQFEDIKKSLDEGKLPTCLTMVFNTENSGVIRMQNAECEACLGHSFCLNRGILAVRLSRRIGVLGALVVSGSPEFVDDDQEQQLLKEIADDISLALANIDHQKVRNEHVAELATSKKWLSTTLRSIGDAVICTDVDGTVTFINPVAEELTGWESEEATGRPLNDIFKIINQLTREAVDNPIEQVFHEGTIVGLANHTVLISRNGQEYPIEDSGAPIKDDKGAIKGAVLVFHDVTERRNAELKILRERDRAKQYLSLAGSIFVAIDRNMIVSLINKKGCEVLGFEKDEILGKNWFDLVIPEKIRDNVKAVYGKLMSGEIEPAEYYENEVLTSDGQTRVIAWQNSVIRDADGNIIQTISSGLDITEKNAAINALLKSENQFRSLVQTIPHGVKIIDANGRIMYANESYHRIFGYEKGEMIGMNFLSVVADDMQRAKDIGLFKSILEEQPEPKPIIRACRTKTGDEIDIQLDWAYRYNENGKLTGFVGIVTDITERKRAREVLEAEKERLAVTLSSIGDGVIATDTSGTVVIFNHISEELTGWKKEEALGQKLEKVFHIINEKTRERCDNPVEKVIKFDTIVGLANHTMLVSRDGTERAIADSGAPIRARDGAILGVVLVFRDVTETNRLRDLAERAQRLETAGRIAGQVAHDFNNLLAPLMAYPELIRDEISPESPIIGYVNDMERAAVQIAEINQQLLTLGRRGHYNLEPLDMNTIVRDVIKQHVSLHVGIKVNADYEKDLFLFKGGASQIFRVVSNLAINALDAMKEVGALYFRTENFYVDHPLGKNNRVPTGEYVKLTVSDAGSGIPPEVAAKIFDPFFSTKTSDRRRGSGLGLSVVHAVVEDHNGYIDFDSRLGQGTSFYLYFPVTRESLPGAEDSTIVGGNEKILVVDDDELQRTVCLTLLRNLGYDAQAVKSGEAAVEYFRDDGADLIILDMIMPPGIDGTETFGRILRLNPDQKALVVSGFAHSERIEEALHLGAGAFIRKPLTIKSLARAVRNELDRKQEANVGSKDKDSE